MLKYKLGQKVMYNGVEVQIVGVDKRDNTRLPYAVDVLNEEALFSYSKNIARSNIEGLDYIDTDKNVHTWVSEDRLSEIKPKAVKVNLDNLMEVGKWFMELTGKKPFAGKGLEFYEMFMDGSYEHEDSIWLVENDDNTFHYNHSKTMETPRLHDEWEVLEYKKEDKGMRFEKEGFEFRGWKLGEEVMYAKNMKVAIVGFGLSDGGVEMVCISIDLGWEFDSSSAKYSLEGVVFIEGIEGRCYWVCPHELTKIAPKTTKIYSFADLHGKKSACGNFFIEATPTLIKVFTKTATRDSVGVFQVGRTSKLNTLADLTNFGFELYELVEFELSDVTKKKFVGFGNKKVCKLASIGDVWFVRVYHDGKDGQYDTISLTKEDKINKTDFLVGEVK